MTKKINLLVSAILTVALWITLVPPAQAFVTTTGGDGFVPAILNDKIFNTFHHQDLSTDPQNPAVDISCFEKIGGDTCPGYPRYFSSTVGSTGRRGLGTSGTPDIITTYYPHFSTIMAGRIFYAAQRVADNGIGCFDLNNNVNCGYFQLGPLLRSFNHEVPASVDGLVQEGTRLYSTGKDVRMYCLEVADPLAPVPCPGQPYPLNTGIEAELPPFNGANFEVPDNAITPDQTKIYIDFNYFTATPAQNARLTCFDTLTNARCAGWTSTPIAGSSAQYSRSVVHVFDSVGNFTGICASTVISQLPQCFNPISMAPVPAPPNFLSNIPSRDPREITWVWDHVDSDHQTVYLAISAGGPGNFGEAYCYSFKLQSVCPNFGTNGVKAWDGLDGGIAVNGGTTKDYGYAIDNLCMYGLGDAGILWSFESLTGKVAIGLLNCTANEDALRLAAAPGLPNTGVGPKTKNSNQVKISALVGSAVGIYIAFEIRKRKISKIY